MPCKNISTETAGVYIEDPSHLGFLGRHKTILRAHEKGATFVIDADPTSLGLFASLGELGADIAIGEGQPLGNHMNYGGPLLARIAVPGQAQEPRVRSQRCEDGTRDGRHRSASLEEAT